MSQANSSSDDSYSDPSPDSIRDVFKDDEALQGLNSVEWTRLKQVAQDAMEQDLGFMETATVLIEALVLLRYPKLFRDAQRLRGMCNQLAHTIIGDPQGRVRMVEFQRHLLNDSARG